MQRIQLLFLAALIASPAVRAAEPVQAPAADASKSVVTLSEVMDKPKLYANKTLTITGRYAGMCSDGADFYFKDGLSTVEVLLPPAGMPKDLKKGAALRVKGLVVVRRDGDEVLIQPTSVEAAETPGSAR